MAMNRDSILRVTKSAATVLRDIGEKERAIASGRVDVFGAIEAQNIPLLFRPLDGLLGAYVTDPSPGVLVTTQRPLSILRFTAAHELGHAILGHRPSLDDDNMIRRIGVQVDTQFDDQEYEADFFAMAFLSPAWLIGEHARQQSWTHEHLSHGSCVYQLALRLGISYAAACVALRQHRIIDRAVHDRLQSETPKNIKEQLLDGITPENWYMNVWHVTSADHGVTLDPTIGDYIVCDLEENSGAGYRWEIRGLSEAAIRVVGDRYVSGEPDAVGGAVQRRITAHVDGPCSESISLSERRPWDSTADALHSLRFSVTAEETIEEGLSTMTRRRLLGAA